MNTKTLTLLLVTILALCATVAFATPTVTFEDESTANGFNSTNSSIYLQWNVTAAVIDTTLCNVSFYGGTSDQIWTDLNITNGTNYNNSYNIQSGGNAQYLYNVTCTDLSASGVSATREFMWDNVGPTFENKSFTTTASVTGDPGIYTFHIDVIDALRPVNSSSVVLLTGTTSSPSTENAMTNVGGNTYEANVTLTDEGTTFYYGAQAQDDLTNSGSSTVWSFLITNASCSNTKGVIFAAFGLLAILCLALAAVGIIQIFQGNVDITALMTTTIGMIGLAMILLIGYVVIQNVAASVC